MSGTNHYDAISMLMQQQLGGVYRDPARVTRDASALLQSKQGKNLRVKVAPLVQNDGSSTPPILMMEGTIPMRYKNAEYNIPLEVCVTPPYPVRPPVLFVRPSPHTMALKENHRHVAHDGMVYMPYLHSWRPHNHNLIDLIRQLSTLFGQDPPVYAKPANQPPRATTPGAVHVRPPSSSSQQQQQQQQDIPPTYEDILKTSLKEAEERNRQLEAAEVEEAIRAAEAAQLSEEEERVRQAAQREARELRELRNQLTRKVQLHLQEHYQECRTDLVQHLLPTQKKLQAGTKIVQLQTDHYTKFQTHLQQHKGDKSFAAKVQNETEQLQTLIQEAESEGGEPLIDELVLPKNVPSKQMLELSAQVASLTDAMYFMDTSLANNVLDLPTHLRQVRKLAKQQFMAKALLLKIAQSKQPPFRS